MWDRFFQDLDLGMISTTSPDRGDSSTQPPCSSSWDILGVATQYPIKESLDNYEDLIDFYFSSSDECEDGDDGGGGGGQAHDETSQELATPVTTKPCTKRKESEIEIGSGSERSGPLCQDDCEKRQKRRRRAELDPGVKRSRNGSKTREDFPNARKNRKQTLLPNNCKPRILRHFACCHQRQQ
ncbi:hypothetical protein Cantr_05849 [Candida viswanathii]|uniref:Uncharacterized protein n=1 Tax=Candida viswanathii TaxID=5486 RepID=A0A367XQZ3_9ASCO|nr:hypothetical protein Cantr_05849 [Candida viswanathii]